MIVTFRDGSKQTLHPVNHCTGYVAKEVLLDALDLKYLASVAERDPQRLAAIIMQLSARVNRIGNT